MRENDALDAVHVLEQASGAEVKFIHVVRNPFDNIATMTLQAAEIKKKGWNTRNEGIRNTGYITTTDNENSNIHVSSVQI